MTKQLISLTELSKILDTPKSTLHYYVQMGLISPKEVIGRMYIFDKNEFIKKYKFIKREVAKGKNLEEVKALGKKKQIL